MLEDRVYAFIRRANLIPSGSRVLAAVSGGPDSVALLQLLYNLRQALGISLVVAHLDHNLRGEESTGDALHVAELAGQLDLPFAIGGRDVAGYRSQHGLSLEEAAREVRYGFLCEVAAESGASVIATGHTLNDNVETILMHLIRGTGTLGLKGLASWTSRQAGGKNFEIIRPLLETGRNEIEAYCRERGLATRLDSTNLSLSPLRNRIRLELLPLLEGYNPGMEKALLRLADLAGDELDFLSIERDKAWGRVVKREKNTIILDKVELGGLHPALKRSILRRALAELAGSLKDFEAGHIEDMLAILEKPAGKQLVLPRGFSFTVEYGRYLLGKAPEELCPFPPVENETVLQVPGVTQAGAWKVTAEIIEGGGIKPDTGAFTAYLDFDRTGRCLSMRPRQPGDRFFPLGGGGQKRVKGFLIDARVPRLWRDNIPVITAARDIVWLAGLRIDERFKVTENTKRVLRLALEY
ncbi:MAG: tRNA lysidine(34) synthetase TilS [Dehalococcoidaceae bacterium]|nr:tRNA lysidine(34) synthetase TilS [Dehalococcoidaceae bacterium]